MLYFLKKEDIRILSLYHGTFIIYKLFIKIFLHISEYKYESVLRKLLPCMISSLSP